MHRPRYRENPLLPDELDRVLEKEVIERFVARRRHETTHHIRPMHTSPPSRFWDDDWQPPSQDPPGFTQPDPRTTPVVKCIETRRSTVPVTAGSAILNWKKPDPRLKDRDVEVARLAFVEGLGQKEIADRIAAQGYSPVTPDRIGQVLNAHSGRDRIIRFLALAPEGQTFTTKEIAIALSIDTSRVQYVLDGLHKKNIVSFRDVRNGPDSSDHKTKVDIHLNRRARGSRIVTSVMSHKPVGATPPMMEPVNTSKVNVVEEVIDHPDIEQIFEAVDGPKPGESGPGSDEDWGTTIDNLGRPMVTLPWIKGSLGGFPVIRDLRDRAIRAAKLNAAAKILEEVGEDDMVLALMAKTEFTGLESEVVTLLRTFGEIE